MKTLYIPVWFFAFILLILLVAAAAPSLFAQVSISTGGFTTTTVCARLHHFLSLSSQNTKENIASLFSASITFRGCERIGKLQGPKVKARY